RYPMGLSTAKRPISGAQLHVKPEMDNVAVLDHVLFAFQAPFAGVFRALFALIGDEVVVADYFCPDKAPLKVGVDYAGGLGSGCTYFDSPGPYFFHAGGKVGLQAQQLVAGDRKSVV